MTIYNVTVTTLDYEGRVEDHDVSKGYFLNKDKADAKAEELKKKRMFFRNVEVKDVKVEE